MGELSWLQKLMINSQHPAPCLAQHLLSIYLLHNRIKSTCSPEPRIIWVWVSVVSGDSMKYVITGAFAHRTTILSTLWVLSPLHWLALLRVLHWFLIGLPTSSHWSALIYIFIPCASPPLQAFSWHGFWISNGHLKLKMFIIGLSPKVGGNFSYSGQETCSSLSLLFSSHLASN